MMPNTDVDALQILPLRGIPLATKALREARLVKNARLESMLEMFQGEGSGSGQLPLTSLNDFFDFSGERRDDLAIISKLGELPSYDVYSLRVSFADLGIELKTLDSLRLSEAKIKELSRHTGAFTRPLAAYVYGDPDLAPASLDDLLRLAMDPNAAVARDNLVRLAGMLEIELSALPAFIETYADVFMSLSYFRQCAEDVAPLLGDFLEAADDIATSNSFTQNRTVVTECNDVTYRISLLFGDVNSVIGDFRRRLERLWDNPTADHYRRIETTVLAKRPDIGAVLCALSVKLNAWHDRFPPEKSGQLAAKIAFILSEMKQGLEHVVPAGGFPSGGSRSGFPD
jgi:hypothetical protein